GIAKLFLLRVIAVRHGADYNALPRIFLRIFDFRPIFHIKERAPFLRVSGESLHKRCIAVFAGMGAAHIRVDRITANWKAGFGHNILCLNFTNQNAVLFYLCHFCCASNTCLNASGNSCTMFASPTRGTRSSFIKAGMPSAWACSTREYAHAGSVRTFLLFAPVIVPTTIQSMPERFTSPGSSNSGSKVT